MIEAPLALFQVQVKGRRRHTVELLQAALSKAPEALYPVDVALVVSELVITVIDPVMLSIADID